MSSIRLSELRRDPDKRFSQKATEYRNILDNVTFSEVATITSKAAEGVLRVDITLPEKLADELQLQLGNDSISNSRDPHDSIIVQAIMYTNTLQWNSSISYDSIMPGEGVQISPVGPRILLEMTGTIELKLILKECNGANNLWRLGGRIISGEVNKCCYGTQWF